MLGQPVADVAQRIGMTGEVDAVAQGGGGSGAGGDDGEVEDGERDHGGEVVGWRGGSKGAEGGWDEFRAWSFDGILPTGHRPLRPSCPGLSRASTTCGGR